MSIAEYCVKSSQKNNKYKYKKNDTNKNLNFRDRQRKFIVELSKAIQREIHETYTIGAENTPRCLIGHINTANNFIEEPFSTPEITKITQILTQIMYDLSSDSVTPTNTLCKRLIDYMELLHDARDILDYIRWF